MAFFDPKPVPSGGLHAAATDRNREAILAVLRTTTIDGTHGGGARFQCVGDLTRRLRWVAYVAPLLAWMSVMRSATAQASCAPPPAKLVWSYPADGASDVPTDAHLFFLTSLGAGIQEVTVNGQVISTETLPQGSYGLAPQLEPNTAYAVSLKIGAADNAGFSFTTGAGPAGSIPAAPFTIKRVTATATRDLSPQCAAAVAAMDCFDTGQNTHLVFDTDTHPVLFFVSGPSIPWTMTWPGECGAPEVFATTCAGPYTIYAVSATGQSSTATADCSGVTPRPAAATPPMSGGCSVSPRSAPRLSAESVGLLSLLLLLGLSFARRRHD